MKFTRSNCSDLPCFCAHLPNERFRGASCLGLEPLCHARRFCSFRWLKVVNRLKDTFPCVGFDSKFRLLGFWSLQAPTQMTRVWCQVLFKLRPESQLRVGSSQPQRLNRVQVMERPATSLRRHWHAFACLNMFRKLWNLLIGRTLEDLQAWIKSWNSMSQVW